MATIVNEYSAMAIGFSSATTGNSSGPPSSGTYSFTSLGPATVNGSTYDKIAFNITATGSNTPGENVVAYVAQDGTFAAAQAQYSGQTQNLTSSEAQSFGFIADFFGLVTDSSYISTLFISGGNLHAANSSTVTYGSTSMPVTTYSPNSVPYTETYCGVSANIGSIKIDLGSLSGGTVLTEFSVASSSSSTSSLFDSTFSLNLLSITLV